MFLHILVNQFNRKTSISNTFKTKWPVGSVSLEIVFLKLFTEKPSSSVVNWDSFGATAVFGGQEKWKCNSACPGKRWKCNCAYPQKVKVHEQIVQGSCHLHVFLPLCTWRGKERQSLHFTWHFIFYLSISPDCLTYTLAVLILFLVDWDIDPRSLWIRAPTRSIPAQVAVGEELTWSYTNVLQPQAATLSKHLDTWMFKCTCPRWKTWSTEALLTKKTDEIDF